MMQVTVVLARPTEQQCIELDVPDTCTAREAVGLAVEAGLRIGASADGDSDIDTATVTLGVYGRAVDDGHRLSPGDRVELYRPLHQDPKEWRRRRAQEAQT